MTPLSFADTGEENIIKRISANSEGKKHLAHLGFTPGSSVTLIARIGGNVIVKVKESRIAISREMAQKIMI